MFHLSLNNHATIQPGMPDCPVGGSEGDNGPVKDQVKSHQEMALSGKYLILQRLSLWALGSVAVYRCEDISIFWVKGLKYLSKRL